MNRLKGTMGTMKSAKITGSIATGVGSDINVDFPADWKTCGIQKLKIHNIAVTGELSNTTGNTIDFDLLFFGKDTHGTDTTDTSAENLLGEIVFLATDFDGSAYTGGGASFRAYKDLADNPVYYVDQDNTSELHMTFINRDADTLSASDSLQITFTVEVVL